jgi:hypothetical protein
MIPLTPTDVLREELARAKIASPESYEWDGGRDGEPLYRGDPITGRASPSEDKAFAATEQRLWAEFEPCIDCDALVNVSIGQCGACAKKDGYE